MRYLPQGGKHAHLHKPFSQKNRFLRYNNAIILGLTSQKKKSCNISKMLSVAHLIELIILYRKRITNVFVNFTI